MQLFLPMLCRIIPSIAIVAVLISPIDSAANDQLSSLVGRLPDYANAVILLNAADLFESEISKRQGWRNAYASAFEASPLLIPPSAEHAVLAAELDVTNMQPIWESAVIRLSSPPTAGDLAAKIGGVADEIGGYDAAWIGSGLCIIRFEADEFGVLTPTNRQAAARWASRVKRGNEGRVSSYLLDALDDSGESDVVFAIDLQNTVRLEDVAAAVDAAALFENLPKEQVAALLASIQGVTLRINADQQLAGRLRVDFGQDVSPVRSICKELMLGALSNAGAMLQEFAAWSCDAQGQSIVMEGELTLDGMRRLLSLISVNGALVDQADPQSATTDAADVSENDQMVARASLRYFRGVAKYVDDLNRLQRAQSIDQAALWISNYARRIERLPTTNVDPELVQYGYSVANRFRQVVDAAHGAVVRAAEASDPLPGNSKVTVGALPTARRTNWGGHVYREYAPYAKAQVDVGAARRKREIAQDEIQQAINEAASIFQQIVSETSQVRNTMSTRYSVDF